MDRAFALERTLTVDYQDIRIKLGTGRQVAPAARLVRGADTTSSMSGYEYRLVPGSSNQLTTRLLRDD